MININRQGTNTNACKCKETPTLLTPKEAGRYLKIASSTLEKWRMKKMGPNFMKLGNRTIRYRIEDLQSFIETSTIKPCE